MSENTTTTTNDNNNIQALEEDDFIQLYGEVFFRIAGTYASGEMADAAAAGWRGPGGEFFGDENDAKKAAEIDAALWLEVQP